MLMRETFHKFATYMVADLQKLALHNLAEEVAIPRIVDDPEAEEAITEIGIDISDRISTKGTWSP